MSTRVESPKRTGQIKDLTAWARETLELPGARGELIFLKEWKDSHTRARGWFARWGRKDLTVSGGGVRMKPGASANEAVFLASTMFEKFGISGPEINGSKFVIDHDPSAPDKLKVLERYLVSFLPSFENTGTAGDLGVSEQEVAEILARYNIPNPQWGVVNGLGITEKLPRLAQTMSLVLEKPFSPKHQNLVDISAGWSTFKAIEIFLSVSKEALAGKTVILQGVGAVGGSAAYFLENAGAKIVATADKKGSLRLNGTPFAQLVQHITPDGCLPRDSRTTRIGDSQAVLYLPADILVLAAASEVVTRSNAHRLSAPLIFEGANHPITPEAESHLAAHAIKVFPDFVVNAGTAELFTIGELSSGEVSETRTLNQIADITANATREVMKLALAKKWTYRQAAREISTLNLWKKYI